jgi:UDP-2,3-diacylglucosamine pyrophosphatase LpxH
MPDQTKRIFVSDVHLGRGESWDWYQPSKHKANLVSGLEHVLANAGTIKDLVLLGDIFDTWMAPVHKDPATMSQIIEANPEVMKLLAECANKLTNVFYVNGNHDMLTEQRDLDKITGDGRRIKLINRYHAGMLYAEHGNRYAMFNAPDRLHDPGQGLPLGYYITRILAGDSSYLSPRSLAGYVENLFEAAFTTKQIASSVIDALMQHVGLHPDTEVKMPPPRRNVTLGEVQQRYAPLFDLWVEKFGYLYAINAIRGEMNSLGWAADRLCKQDGYRVVIFGHTHDAQEDEDRLLVSKRRLYLNCGYFCTPNPTLVEIDKERGGNLKASLLTVGTDGRWVPRFDPIVMPVDWVEADDGGPSSMGAAAGR